MPPDTAVAERNANPIVPIQSALNRREPALLAFLPSEQVRERFLRIVYQAVQKNPDLMDCTPESIAAAAVEAAMYGLEPSGAAGGAHLVPFRKNVGTKDRPQWIAEAQLIVDYRGQMQLARDSEKVEDAYAVVVRKADRFRYDAANQKVEHEPDLTASQSPNPDDKANPMTHVYAVVVFRSGYRRPEVMSRVEVDAVRAMSKAANGPAWTKSYLEMAKKTVLHRALKTAPLRPGARAILERDPDFDFEQPRVSVEHVGSQRPRLADRLRERRHLATSEPTEQPAGAEAGDGEAVPARAAASPNDAAEDEGTGTPPSEATEPSTVSSPPGGGDSADSNEADDPAAHAEPEEKSAAAGASSSPTESSPAASSTDAVGQALAELIASPSKATFERYAAANLGIEGGVAIADLVPADLEQVVAGIDPTWYPALYQRLPAAVKANLRGAKLAPAKVEGPA